jgi:hypothetical protein
VNAWVHKRVSERVCIRLRASCSCARHLQCLRTHLLDVGVESWHLNRYVLGDAAISVCEHFAVSTRVAIVQAYAPVFCRRRCRRRRCRSSSSSSSSSYRARVCGMKFRCATRSGRLSLHVGHVYVAMAGSSAVRYRVVLVHPSSLGGWGHVACASGRGSHVLHRSPHAHTHKIKSSSTSSLALFFAEIDAPAEYKQWH